jgi:hypothetical protein
MSGAPSEFSPYDGDEPYVFVSYERKDQSILLPILEALAAEGVRLWWDRGLIPGDDFGARIEQRLQGCAAVIVLLSANSFEKKTQNWVLQETKLAAELKKELIPLVCDERKRPLEWRSLVDHLQLVSLVGRSSQEVAVEMLKRDAVRRATKAQLNDKQSARVSAHTPSDSPNTSSIAPWARECLRLLAEIRDCLQEFDAAVETWEDGTEDESGARYHCVDDEEPDPPDLRLPLEIDTETMFEPCREMLRQGRKLDCFDVPFAMRLRSGSELIRRCPTAMDATLARALTHAHLINILSVLRLFVEAQETPNRIVREAIARVRTLSSSDDPSAFSQGPWELRTLLTLCIDCLEFEIYLIADAPSQPEIMAATKRGHLAYSSDWQDRLDAFIELEKRAFDWVCAVDFEAPEDAEDTAPLLYEFTRFEGHAAWLRVSAEFLLFPDGALKAASPRSKEDIERRFPSLIDIDAISLSARGAWRVFALAARGSIDFGSRADEDRDEIIRCALKPIRYCVHETGSWAPPACCAESSILLRMACELDIGRLWNSYYASSIAGLMHRIIEDADNGSRDLELLALAGQQCASASLRAGSYGRKYWCPSSDSANTPTSAILWSNLLVSIAQDQANKRDAFIAAIGSDPDFSALKSGLRFHRRAWGSETADAHLDAAEAFLAGDKPLHGRAALRFLSNLRSDRKTVAKKLTATRQSLDL